MVEKKCLTSALYVNKNHNENYLKWVLFIKQKIEN
jgi:hypothetical protein